MDPLSAFARIKQRSLFVLLDEIDAFALSGVASVVTVPAGQAVPRPSGPSQLFIVVSGDVRLQTAVGEVIGRVGSGRSLELGTFLARSTRWQSDWFCEQESVLLALPETELREVIDATPGLAIYLERMCADVGIRKLKNDLRLGGIAQKDITRLISRLTRQAWKSLKTQYASSPGLAVLEQGRLSGEIEIKGTREPVGPFRGGDLFYLDEGVTSIQCDDAARLWFMPRSAWQSELSKKYDFDAFRAISDPIAVKRAALEAALAEPQPPPPPPPPEEEDDGLSVADFKLDEQALARLHRKRRPFVRQHEEMDCAAACLSMVARFYGRRISVPTFRSMVHVTRDGASMLAIKKAAGIIGMKAMGVTSGLKGLRKMRVPMIALMDYHYVVVYAVSETEVSIGDPATGLSTLPAEEFEARWSKSALLFSPTPAFEKYPESQLSFAKYAVLFRGTKMLLLEVLLASVLMFGFGLTMPVMLQYIVDSVLPSGSPGALTLVALGLLLARVTSAAIGWIHRYLLVHVTSKVDALSSVLFVRQLLAMPLGFFVIRTVGDITQRMGEIRRIRSIVLDQSLQLFTVALGGVVNSVVIFMYSPQILGVLLLGLIPPALFVAFFAPRLNDKTRAVHKAAGDWQTRSWEQFDGLASIKALGGEVAARWKWNMDLRQNLVLRQELGWLEAIARASTTLFEQLLGIALLLYAVHAYASGQITAGHVLAVSMLGTAVIGAAMTLMSSWHEINELGVSLGRVDDVLTAAIEPPGPPEDPAHPHPISGKVALENVSFQYGSELSPVVLSGVNLSVEPGETVALVGRSGSGKSTLGYMFNLLYTPTQGKIRFDGVEHTEIPLQQVRKRAAMIVQDNSIFSGTILENIALGDPHPSFQRVMEAAQAADAHQFVTGFPKGYSTLLGESGEGLSGGQKQRINIARALYRNPAILIMDEATSALDAISEARIVKQLKARKGTTIVIAHRLNTVMHADRIVVLDAGRVVEQGTHTELLAKRGHYSRLFAKQLAV